MSKRDHLKYLGFATAAVVATKEIPMSNEPTIEQINEAIALFDGWKYIPGDPSHVCLSCDNGTQPSGWCTCDRKSDRFQKEGKMVTRTYFQYHWSWDYLMPVWKRIIDAVAGLTEAGDYPVDFSSIMDMYAYHCENVEIRSAHNYVYQAIQWYNNQSTTTNE